MKFDNEKPLEFWALLTAGGAVELINMKRGNGRYFTTLVRGMKDDKIGRALLILSWSWLTYHFFFENGDEFHNLGKGLLFSSWCWVTYRYIKSAIGSE